jgi:hypothetical protein
MSRSIFLLHRRHRRSLLLVVLAGALGCSSSSSGNSTSDGGGGDGQTNGGHIALGAPCDVAGDACAQPDGKEVVCDCAGGSSKPTCVARIDVGATCGTSGAGCRTGAYCDGRANVCTAYHALGEKCHFDDGGGSSHEELCARGLACGASGNCETGKAAGETCDFVFDDCALGLYCPFTGQTCQPTLAVGASCPSDRDACGTGAACISKNGAPSTCVKLAANGEACTTDLDCGAGLRCNGKTCVSKAAGAPGLICGF